MPKCILLVDDNPTVRALTRNYLEQHANFRVCGEAGDGHEAVAKAIELSPDLIVMDLSMPRMNGLEASRELKDKLPHVPIILFTLHRSAVSNLEAKMAGVSSIVSKSSDQEDLVDEILKLTRRH